MRRIFGGLKFTISDYFQQKNLASIFWSFHFTRDFLAIQKMGRFAVKICYGTLSGSKYFQSVFTVLKFSIGFVGG